MSASSSFYIVEYVEGEVAGLLGVLPEIVFEQLPCFDGKGFGEVFGIVKLRPIAFVAKIEDFLFNCS